MFYYKSSRCFFCFNRISFCHFDLGLLIIVVGRMLTYNYMLKSQPFPSVENLFHFVSLVPLCWKIVSCPLIGSPLLKSCLMSSHWFPSVENLSRNLSLVSLCWKVVACPLIGSLPITLHTLNKNDVRNCSVSDHNLHIIISSNLS